MIHTLLHCDHSDRSDTSCSIAFKRSRKFLLEKICTHGFANWKFCSSKVQRLSGRKYFLVYFGIKVYKPESFFSNFMIQFVSSRLFRYWQFLGSKSIKLKFWSTIMRNQCVSSRKVFFVTFGIKVCQAENFGRSFLEETGTLM